MELTCSVCGKKFERRAAEVKRCLARGHNRVFCSRACCGKGVLENIPESKRSHPDNLVAGNRKDEFSPFRFHLRNAKQRKHRECDLTLSDLKELWEKQGGRCPYTGWELKNMDCLTFSKQLPLTPDRASLDRVDSTKGYVKGNVQFVSYMAQCCKHQFDETKLLQFCEAVIKKQLYEAR